MALIPARAASASFDTVTAQKASHIPTAVAGEALDPIAPCYIKASDGKVYMSNGTAATEPSKVHGWTPRAYAVGEPVSLYGPGTRARYADSGLTAGNTLFLGTTKGRLDSAATTGDAVGIAFAVSATDIVFGNYKLV